MFDFGFSFPSHSINQKKQVKTGIKFNVQITRGISKNNFPTLFAKQRGSTSAAQSG